MTLFFLLFFCDFEFGIFLKTRMVVKRIDFLNTLNVISRLRVVVDNKERKFLYKWKSPPLLLPFLLLPFLLLFLTSSFPSFCTCPLINKHYGNLYMYKQFMDTNINNEYVRFSKSHKYSTWITGYRVTEIIAWVMYSFLCNASIRNLLPGCWTSVHTFSMILARITFRVKKI